MSRPHLAAVARAGVLVASTWAGCAGAAEEPAAAPIPAAAASATVGVPERSYTIPALEIVGFDFLLNRYNRRFSGSRDYDVDASTIRRNLRGPWIEDDDPFKVNQFAHPYQGSLYHGAGRAAGLGYWTSAAYTFTGSAWWEITGEQTPPSRNDQIASGVAGSFLGEPLFRLAHLMLEHQSGDPIPYTWRKWMAAAISPPLGLNHALYGGRFDAAFDDHGPVYYGRLRLGANHVASARVGNATGLRDHDAEADIEIDYGLPGQPGYTYTRPFDYFALRASASSAHGVQRLATRGLLFGTDYAVGDRYRGIWGLYGNYDYVAPQIFNLSSTALSVGTTGQWWAARELAVQGTVLAGLGYSAASTSRGNTDDRDYHYGMAPRFGLDLRVTADARMSLDMTLQRYLLGRIANRSAGRDDVSLVDTALTWRVSGRHAVGVKAVRTRRHAVLSGLGDRGQSVTTVGIYYTVLGLDTFGTVEWRNGAR